MKSIQLVDLVGQYQRIKSEIDREVLRVISSGQYIVGKDVEEFEKEIAAFLNVKHAIGCASGTDALLVALLVTGIKPGDEVITTPFTFVATVEMIVLLGAKPVYADIEPLTYNLDTSNIEPLINKRTKAIIPVHLYGHPVDMDPLLSVAKKHGLVVIEDMCQAIGAEYKGKKVGGLGDAGCISFFPSKNLGAFGDAGMMVTNDDEIAEKARMIIIHGSRERYKHELIGINGRLDTIQAAILRVKLKYLEEWTKKRRESAVFYNKLFENSSVQIPYESAYAKHVFHQYTIRVENREKIMLKLNEKKIPYGIYYPIPLHLQKAYACTGKGEGSLPNAESAAKEVISLPMHTELDEEQQTYIAKSVMEAIG